MRTLLVALSVCSMYISDTAHAGKRASAAEPERERLEQEIETLAGKNAWAGVERVYLKLVDLEEPASVGAHLLGAQAARDRGDTLGAVIRLKGAIRAGAGTLVEPGTPIDEAMQSLEDLEGRYGRVRIRVGDKREPALLRPKVPFAPDERASIEHARTQLVERRYFRGMLPTGVYVLDGFEFEVASGPNFQDVTQE